MGKQSRLRAEIRAARKADAEREILKLRFVLEDETVYVVDRPTGRVICQIDPVQGGIDLRDPFTAADAERHRAWTEAAGESLRRGDFQEVPWSAPATFGSWSTDD